MTHVQGNINRHRPLNVLAIRMQANGDVWLTLPYLNALRKQLPQGSRLHFLTRAETAPVPVASGIFDKIYILKGGRSTKRQRWHALWLKKRLKGTKYDVVIDLQNHALSRQIVRSLKPAVQVAFDKYSPRPAGVRTQAALIAAGWQVSPDYDFPGRACWRQEGAALLRDHGWQGEPLIVLNPAACFASRQWPVERFAAWAKRWVDEICSNVCFVLLGTKQGVARLRQLKQRLGDCRCIDLLGKTTAAQAWGILLNVSLVLSEDSGLMHLAWSSGVPTVALLGGTRSDWARPLGQHTFCFDSGAFACHDCMWTHCVWQPPPLCMSSFTVDKVLAQCYVLWEKYEQRTF